MSQRQAVIPCPIWGEDFWGLTSPSAADLAEWTRLRAGEIAEHPTADLARYLEGPAR